ncbi:MAG: hypothetical protein PUF56_04365 [Lachnospiraceae bacterium]|nr:hypothetical protein [Lachnospiraceae bacterium]
MYPIEDLQKLMESFAKSGLTYFRYKHADGVLELKNEPVIFSQETLGESRISGKPSTDCSSGFPSATVFSGGQKTAVFSVDPESATEGSENATDHETDQSAGSDQKLVEVKAPLAGVFYRASKPGAKPFVEEGQEVKKGDIVGLVEAMKMMNEIPAPCDGIVHEIKAEDAKYSEYDAVLMTLEEL